VVFSVSRDQMGNTTIRTTRIHCVRILEVNADHVVASWNGNSTKKFYSREFNKWRVSKPTVVSGLGGCYTRLATKAEVDLAKAENRLRDRSDRIQIVDKPV